MGIMDNLRKIAYQQKSEYPDIFHSKNWYDATEEAKIKALQKLENEQAKKQNRMACMVKTKQYDNMTILKNN